MNLSNTPLNEKFQMLAFLQTECKNVGNFIIQYLKTKKTFQISFINGLNFSSQADDIETCVKSGIIQLEIEYSKQHGGRDFFQTYKMSKDVELYKHRIIELEDKVKELEDNYSRDIVKQKTNDILDPLNKILETYKPKRKRGRPSKSRKSNKSTQQVFDDRDGVPTIKDIDIINSPIIWDVSDKKKKELRERTKERSGLFTEKQLEKEMRRLNSDLPTNLLYFRSTKKYETERKKAYKRLANKKYLKTAERKQNLTIGDNKYNITKQDIIDDMKRVIKEDLSTISNIQYLKEWTKAKSRVWNREYNKAKNNPW